MSDLKSRYDVGWFSAYDTLKGMVVLYGFSKVLEALMEIGNLTPDAADLVVCTCETPVFLEGWKICGRCSLPLPPSR